MPSIRLFPPKSQLPSTDDEENINNAPGRGKHEMKRVESGAIGRRFDKIDRIVEADATPPRAAAPPRFF